MSGPALTFEDVQIRADQRLLLDVPDFTLAAGELAALIGPNGSGKTTFLHAAALLRHAAGRVAIGGEVVTSQNAAHLRRRISVVFQDPLLFSVSVLDNAAAGLHFHGVPRAAARDRATEWLRLFGVAHLAHRKPRGLSGGEAARVALARAFATAPDLLLLDEPFSALDAGSRAALIPELRDRLLERRAAAILVTHDLAEACVFAPRLVLLDGGRLVTEGDAEALIRRPPSRRAATLLGAENMLTGRVLAVAGASGLVEVAPGRHLRACCQQPPAVGSGVAVTIPSTLLHLRPPDSRRQAGWNTLSGRIKAITPQPGWDSLAIDAGVPLLVRNAWGARDTPWSPGDSVTVTFPPEAAWIIPETEQVGC
ncbi:MAG: ABC transporter ATP-binding protein [Thermomicrobiales bacterium]|nr:ABC transporter ATP-binding protein [Thermomicrobiales bacterium]